MIKVYSNNCPKCKILLSKLDNKKVEYVKEENIEEIMSFAKKHNITSVPITEWDGDILDFSKAIQKINTI